MELVVLRFSNHIFSKRLATLPILLSYRSLALERERDARSLFPEKAPGMLHVYINQLRRAILGRIIEEKPEMVATRFQRVCLYDSS